MNEQIQTRQTQKLTFSQYVNSKTGQALISNAIQNPAKRSAFVTAIVSAVANNPGLQECTFASIISAALQGVALGLAPSPQLGQFYMVPFDVALKDENGRKVKGPDGKFLTEKRATFVPGYKGYIQLAIRSGLYLDIDAKEIREGEFLGLDPFTGQPKFEFISDYNERKSRAVIGYMSYFILQSEFQKGFRKTLYWPKEKMIDHADKYSPAFSREAVNTPRFSKVSFADYEAGNFPKGDEWKYSSFWYQQFDSMAEKTMLRQLITKWGPVSVEMESAINQDAQNEAQGVDYGAGDFADAALPVGPAGAVGTDENGPLGEPEGEPGHFGPAGEEQVKLDEL